MMEPLVSCILATKNRSRFFKQALKYFHHQNYPNKELIVVDDGDEFAGKILNRMENVKYVKLKSGTTLGNKLNVGVEESQGEVIQKLDDDDYYHPNFLSSAVKKLFKSGENTIVASDCFLVLMLITMELKYSGNGWCAGNTLCFYRDLWKKHPFRNAARAVDWWFLKDNQPNRVKLQDPELVIVVRHHMGHLWKIMGESSVDEYFKRRPNYKKTLKECISYEDWCFYQKIKDEYCQS